MICYKDMTFCKFYKECADGKDCHRALTGEIESRAKAYGLPISQFGSKPYCFKEANDE